MISKTRVTISYLAFGLLAVGVGVASARNTMTGPPDYDLSWHTFEPGGESTGGDFVLRSVMGQPDAGPTMTGGDFTLDGGFLPGGAGPFCPGDVSGESPGIVDVLDLLAVLGAWGPCDAPCPPCPEDVDNDDCVVDVLDLLKVLGSWGTCP